MGKYDGFLICTDIDGTLAVNGVVPQNNVEAINRFKEGGGNFVIATGRDYDYIDNFKDKFALDKYIISCNGNVLYNIEKDVVEEAFLLDERAMLIAEDVYSKFKERLNNIDYCGTSGRVHLSRGEDMSAEKSFEKFNNKICKVVYMTDTPETAEEIKEYLKKDYDDDYEICLAWSTGVEFWQKGAGKGRMIKLLREKFPNVHTIICAGDYENDIPMLKEADISYAPQNACDDAKAVADIVGVDCMDGLIAQIVNDLDKK